jgi:hypothetical protein
MKLHEISLVKQPVALRRDLVTQRDFPVFESA